MNIKEINEYIVRKYGERFTNVFMSDGTYFRIIEFSSTSGDTVINESILITDDEKKVKNWIRTILA